MKKQTQSNPNNQSSFVHRQSTIHLWPKPAHFGILLDNNGVVWAHFGVILDTFGDVWDKVGSTKTSKNRIIAVKNAKNKKSPYPVASPTTVAAGDWHKVENVIENRRGSE